MVISVLISFVSIVGVGSNYMLQLLRVWIQACMCAHNSREPTVSDLIATKEKSNESSVSRRRIGEEGEEWG